MRPGLRNIVAALGVAGFCAGAQADSGKVAIYGFLNMDFENVKADGAANPTLNVASRNRVSSNLSRVGFKGSEDLAGGLKAVWQVESNVSLDSGSGDWASRESFVGLSSDVWGTVFLGHHDTPYKQARFPVAPVTAIAMGIGGPAGIMGNGSGPSFGNAQTNNSFDRRQKNVVNYWSPKWKGVSAKIAYSANEERGTAAAPNRNPSLWSGVVAYDQGPLYLAVAHERHREYFSPGTTDTGTSVYASYRFGGTKVGFRFERLEYEPSPGAEIERDAWYVSLAHRIGNHTFAVAYTHAEDAEGNTAVPTGGIGATTVADLGETGADQVSLAYTYHFSKRTEVYLMYTRIDNERAARYDFHNNGLGLVSANAVGADPQGFGLGIVHRF